MGSYTLLGSRPGTPRTPVTPRTMQTKMAWWLAISSLALSTFAMFNSSLMSYSAHASNQSSERIVLKQILLPVSADSKLLTQTKPLLIAEEELTEEEIGLLHNDQTRIEKGAREGALKQANKRADVVKQLIAEFRDTEPLSEEVLKQIQREWGHLSITEEDIVTDTQANELSIGHNTRLNYNTDEATGTAAEEEEEERYAEEYAADNAERDADVKLQVEIELELENIRANAAIGEEELVRPAQSTTTISQVAAAGEASESGKEGLSTVRNASLNVTFLDVLSACHSLECLAEAHKYTREPGQFNFPHALLMGWQDSAIGRLTEHLSSHPQVINNELKESEFFTSTCHDSPSTGCSLDHQAHYIQNILQRDAVVASEGKIMSFESSNQYAAAGLVMAEDMAKILPWVKLVASLREPISRAFSVLAHRASSENRGCLTDIEVDLYTCLTREILDPTEGATYTQAMSQWVRAFPKEQVLVVHYEALVDKDQSGVREIKDFLGLDQALPFESVLADPISTEGWRISKDKYLDMLATVKGETEGLLDTLDAHGVVKRDEWMARWEAVWQTTLSTCDEATGLCQIILA